MIQVYSDVIQFRGNHYDYGYMQGELLKDSPILPNRNKQWASRRKRHFVVNEEKAIELLTKFIPGIMDELQGLADALDWELDDALKEFGGYYVEYGRSGCSILTGSSFFIRNYDSRPDSYEGRYVLYQPTDSGYATIGPSMQITGRIDGMNEKGLTMGYNFINRIKSDDGFVCNMIGRMILETCANVDEAIQLLKEIPHRTSFSYALLDPSGKSVIVEASPRSVVAREANISTNHFEMLTEENRYRMDDSIRRQTLLKSHGDGDVYKAFQMLNNADKEVFSKKYGAWSGTLHTAAYVPKERKAWFAIGADRMPVILDFNRFLDGEKMNVKKIKGELDYHTPFINMELL
ncbi:C45 family autoproteolytic acyltransferase/hydrolase [Radiobacillus kanasensis]|uniref:C45 family autoproteolytic acyltransferase/hydolase n=1 Tax=Radiobacillus kanasensis TaxID=2844358 RepID=UPI001E38800D|nr:C45 family peptidase [Radiobacillus kanasensis]UFU00280.1 C45 family autoproteolytic acyltransferase/hydrolase [Radiobacillus kanasensis]